MASFNIFQPADGISLKHYSSTGTFIQKVEDGPSSANSPSLLIQSHQSNRVSPDAYRTLQKLSTAGDLLVSKQGTGEGLRAVESATEGVKVTGDKKEIIDSFVDRVPEHND